MAGTDSLKRVTFSSGAPLDPDDLNTLQQNIDKVNSAATLYNSTISGIKTIPSIQSNTITVSNVKKGVAQFGNLPTFTGDPQIFFTVQQHINMEPDTWVTVSVDKTTTPWKAYVRTNLAKSSNINIDWLAVEMVPVV